MILVERAGQPILADDAARHEIEGEVPTETGAGAVSHVEATGPGTVLIINVGRLVRSWLQSGGAVHGGCRDHPPEEPIFGSPDPGQPRLRREATAQAPDAVDAQPPRRLGQLEGVLGPAVRQRRPVEPRPYPGREATDRRSRRRCPLEQAAGVGEALVLAETPAGVRL